MKIHNINLKLMWLIIIFDAGDWPQDCAHDNQMLHQGDDFQALTNTYFLTK